MSTSHPKKAAKAPESPAVAPRTEENPVPATEGDTPVLIRASDVPAPKQPGPDVPAKVMEAGTPAVTPAVAEKTTELVAAALEGAGKTDEQTAGQLVKVKFLRSHPAFGYFAGQEGEISQDDFDKYSKDGEFFEKL